MNKLHYFFVYLLFFNINVMSIDNFDECGVFKETLNSNMHLFSFDEPDYIQTDRIYLKESIDSFGLEEFIYQRSDANNVFIDDTPTWVYKEYRIEPNSEIISINKILVSQLNDEELYNLIESIEENKETFEILVINQFDEITEHIINYKDNMEVLIPIEFELLNIGNIDSVSSLYTAKYRQTYTWSLLNLDEILKKIITKAILDGVIQDDEDIKFYCEYTFDEFNSLNIWEPDTLLANSISDDSEGVYEKYAALFSYYPATPADNDPYFDIALYKTKIGTATFKSQFNYQPFPFDQQKVTFNIYDPIGVGYLYFETGSNSLSSGYNNIEFYEWNKSGYEVQTLFEKDGYGGFNQIISYQINIERNFIYFITKIYLPIVVILLMSFSTLWINKEELESRLTVSVVCFLALITFTFIIDKDIPKLSYLTSMDLIILTSYIFAALPTINSIYTKRQLSKFGYIKDVNNRFRFYLPILYVFITLSIILITIIDHPNAVGALKFTT